MPIKKVIKELPSQILQRRMLKKAENRRVQIFIRFVGAT
jgi:hypothetical protein